MKLKTITIKGFRVFEDFTFHFPQEAGLYLITGVNEDRPQLGSNGVGKSSLWDAVTFACYSESARRLKGGDLLRDNTKFTEVSLATDTSTITRVWSPTKKMSLKLAGHEVSQEEVVKHIGLDRDMFIATAIIPQLVPLFADYDPATQVTVLQRLLGLQRWLTYAEKASSEASRIEPPILTLKGKVAVLETADWASNIAHLEQQERNWATQHAQRVKEKEVAVVKSTVDAAPATAVEGWNKALSTANSQLLRATHNLAVWEKRIQDTGQKLADAQAAIRTANARREELSKELSFFDSNPTCPLCKQAIAPDYKDTCKQTLQGDFDTITKSVVANTKVTTALTLQLGQERTELRTVQTRLQTLRTQVSTLERQLAVEEQRIRSATAALQSAERALQEVEGETNHYTAMVEDARYKQVAAAEELKTLKGEYDKGLARLEALQLWAKGFKAIRGQMISEALDQFALEIAAVCEDLGLTGWEVKPCIDPSVFESVRVQTGFRFDVTDPNGVKRVLNAYSGGELQRVRLAIQLGLGALVADKAATTLEFECWDEPTNGLSEAGITGLFDSLRRRAERLRRPIFVIDHHSINYSGFDKVYTLVRQGGRTTLQ